MDFSRTRIVQHCATVVLFFPHFPHLGHRARGRLWGIGNATYLSLCLCLGWELGRINLCIDDMWADFDGDAELTLFDWIEFTYLHRASDRRADVNRDRRHDIIDFERVAHALRNVR